ncbi:type II secretion system protein [Candidatus Roizmanbacteria bacterium]|nr:type II secretion system protein [Candidatus Roizmanbacteria bacterium]
MKKLLQRGFTLIELLIVIGILGILVVAVLLTLNPAEAQRKTRDAKRIKDLGTIQTVLDQYIAGGGAAVSGSWDSSAGTTNCNGTGWIGLGAGNSLCQYIGSLPLDPSNNQTRSVANPGAACPNTTTANLVAVYRVAMSAGGEYEVDVVQEATSNCRNVRDDGGSSNQRAEAGNDAGLDLLGN